MESLGQYLRDVREGLNLPLQEVYNRTNIDVTLLSRIENGRRLPTKEQMQLWLGCMGVMSTNLWYCLAQKRCYSHWMGTMSISWK